MKKKEKKTTKKQAKKPQKSPAKRAQKPALMPTTKRKPVVAPKKSAPKAKRALNVKTEIYTSNDYVDAAAIMVNHVAYKFPKSNLWIESKDGKHTVCVGKKKGTRTGESITKEQERLREEELKRSIGKVKIYKN